MDLLLQYFLWVTLTSTSTIKCNDVFPLFEYTQAEIHVTHPELHHDYEYYRPAIRRADHESYVQPTGDKGTNERGAQRMNERSIAVNSAIQRVQEEERMRLQSRADDANPRTENGSYKIVNNFPKPYPSIANRKGPVAEERLSYRDGVVFPGPTSKSSVDFMPEIPEDCRKIGICETVPNYPQDVVDRTINRLGDLHRFHVDVIETSPQIAQRFGGPAEDNIELCDSKEEVKMPKAAKDTNGVWHTIANLESKPLQGYRVEICRSNGDVCAKNFAQFYNGYTATCRQKYVRRVMTAVNVTTEAVYEVNIDVPSCCSCVASHVGKK